MDQSNPSKTEIGAQWRAGFEVEIILGDLGEKRFEGYAMDEASPAYCQAVARELSRLTGIKWTAPRTAKRKPGFYVLPEYDLDPIDFEDTGAIAGVELLTPPLSLNEAQEVREKIVEAVYDLDGGHNGDNDSSRGWHINIDPGHSLRPTDAAKYVVGVNEVEMLCVSNRLGSKYTGLQRHAFGPALIAEMRTPFARLKPGDGFDNFLNARVGRSKRYAAHFRKNRYLELRHYAAAEFFGYRSLSDLLREPISALEMDHASEQASSEHLLETFFVLNDWLREHAGKLTLVFQDDNNQRLVVCDVADVHFAGDCCGFMTVNGEMDLGLWLADRSVIQIYGQLQSQFEPAFAMLCLDVADAILAGAQIELASRALEDAIHELATRLEIEGLDIQPEKVRARWW
ncbi:hypothetical protein FMN50_02015 [Rhodobacterales bacterium]|nr:hypothetical protein FMN50_02015 [Rhodobacterales bacterium]